MIFTVQLGTPVTYEYDREILLVSRVQSGDFLALEELYNVYGRHAFSLAHKIVSHKELAEDAVQEAFLRFWQKPYLFDTQRSRFVTWLLSVVRNICIDQMRRKNYKAMSLDHNETQDQLNQMAEVETTIEETVFSSLDSIAMYKAMYDLPSAQRRLIELAFFEGLSHQEIAYKTGQPLGTIKSRIRQGLLKMRASLEKV